MKSFLLINVNIPTIVEGKSGGSMVLGKLPVLGRPTNLDDSRARAGQNIAQNCTTMRVVETMLYWTATSPQKKICNQSSARKLRLQ